jgi:hypothetical protein
MSIRWNDYLPLSILPGVGMRGTSILFICGRTARIRVLMRSMTFPSLELVNNYIALIVHRALLLGLWVNGFVGRSPGWTRRATVSHVLQVNSRLIHKVDLEVYGRFKNSWDCGTARLWRHASEKVSEMPNRSAKSKIPTTPESRSCCLWCWTDTLIVKTARILSSRYEAYKISMIIYRRL